MFIYCKSKIRMIFYFFLGHISLCTTVLDEMSQSEHIRLLLLSIYFSVLIFIFLLLISWSVHLQRAAQMFAAASSWSGHRRILRSRFSQEEIHRFSSSFAYQCINFCKDCQNRNSIKEHCKFASGQPQQKRRKESCKRDCIRSESENCVHECSKELRLQP